MYYTDNIKYKVKYMYNTHNIKYKIKYIIHTILSIARIIHTITIIYMYVFVMIYSTVTKYDYLQYYNNNNNM